MSLSNLNTDFRVNLAPSNVWTTLDESKRRIAGRIERSIIRLTNTCTVFGSVVGRLSDIDWERAQCRGWILALEHDMEAIGHDEAYRLRTLLDTEAEAAKARIRAKRS